jgi:2-amino-4-hydroxy-6-hydroxymethyldihydropteridine diphosphokinase
VPQDKTEAGKIGETLVALGSNEAPDLGGAERALASAVTALKLVGLEIGAQSRLFRTPCFPPGAGPDFANAALLIRHTIPLSDLLERLHAVEADFGRTRRTRWGPRSLDIDILAHGVKVLPDEAVLRHWIELPLENQKSTAPDTLIVPHPRMQERAFVLIPLADIAPDWVHPVLGVSVAAMLNALPATDKEGVVAVDWPDLDA